MAVVYVNDKPVDIGNDKLNLIEVAQRAGVFIPHYCWHPASCEAPCDLRAESSTDLFQYDVCRIRGARILQQCAMTRLS